MLEFLQPFLTLPFWQQFLILSALFIPINFILCFLLEFGPFASASPLSGGIGFLVVGFFEFILMVVGLITWGAWLPMLLLCVPFVGFIALILIIVVFAEAYQRITEKFARRLGFMY